MITDYMVLKLLILTGVTAYFVGPVKFQFYARQSGYLMGNLVKLIRDSTAVYQEVARDKDLSKISDELKTDIKELKKIGQQLNIGRNLLRSPTQIVRFANNYEEFGKFIEKTNSTEIEAKSETKQETEKVNSEQKVEGKDDILSEKKIVGDFRVNCVTNMNIGGAIYVSKTAIMIQKSKEKDPSTQEKET